MHFFSKWRSYYLFLDAPRLYHCQRWWTRVLKSQEEGISLHERAHVRHISFDGWRSDVIVWPSFPFSTPIPFAASFAFMAMASAQGTNIGAWILIPFSLPIPVPVYPRATHSLVLRTIYTDLSLSRLYLVVNEQFLEMMRVKSQEEDMVMACGNM